MAPAKKTYTVEDALAKLKKYCSYQDRCHKEVAQKLKQMQMIPQASEQIIIVLIEENFLNEERFAMAYVRGKFRIKKWGRRRLVSELKHRQISKYIINKALNQISEDDYKATFDALANRKAASITGSSKLKKKKKLADYLLYRGWESHLVYEKVNQLFN
ncbi:RecX family transcriptional regulator [Flavobacteriaceae bacterium]|nr:RecX family transcriptional regulator [Flavobacteriaceae bacterium]MDB2632646.1 RecX family transcriptional regulator [Flavobacteriaceae bacterium]